MSLESVSNACISDGSMSAIFASFSSGDPFCSIHGNGPCGCYTSVDSSDYTITSTWTCGQCGQVCQFGTYHFCMISVPGSGCMPSVNPFILTLPECAFCDKPLELNDKKVCKECRGVFEAWKFLTKKDEPEPEPEKE